VRGAAGLLPADPPGGGVLTAQRGHFEREQREYDEDVAAGQAAALTAHFAVLPSPDEHPSWCKCQRVCGGDQ